MVVSGAHCDTKGPMTKKYMCLVKVEVPESFMQGNILHSFLISPPWPTEHGFTAVNVCGFSSLFVIHSNMSTCQKW